METFTVTTRLTMEDYNIVMPRLILRNPFVIVINTLGLLTLILAFFNAMHIVQFRNNSNTEIFVTGLLLLALPILMFYSARRKLGNDPKIFKPVNYVFSNEKVDIDGMDYKASLKWGDIHKITATKLHVLIFTSRSDVKIIPRTVLTPEQVNEILQRKNQP